MSPPLLLTNCGSRTEGAKLSQGYFCCIDSKQQMVPRFSAAIQICPLDKKFCPTWIIDANHHHQRVQAALLKHQFPAKAIGGFNEKRVFNKTMTLDLCPIVADMVNEICWTLFKLENLKTIIFIRAMGMRRAWFCLSIECLRDAFVRIQGLNAKLPSEQPQDLILLQLSEEEEERSNPFEMWFSILGTTAVGRPGSLAFDNAEQYLTSYPDLLERSNKYTQSREEI